jgi:hypothetical protein
MLLNAVISMRLAFPERMFHFTARPGGPAGICFSFHTFVGAATRHVRTCRRRGV